MQMGGTMNELEKFKRSPYLELHMNDPVKWNIWDESIFTIAQAEDKPLFITIGYSTCHWCHVMQEESFRSERVASILNEKYVPVVVDREERPDVDAFYMEVSQLMNGSGGWPLNVLALPDGRPFQVFTYLPPDGEGGNSGLIQLLNTISDIWKNERGRITDAADQVSSIILAPDKETSGEIDIEEAVRVIQGLYDRANGGFGSAPKFPNFTYMIFLMNYMRLRSNKSFSYMIQKTLKKIRDGGIYDQVGYGLHRYSTDLEWKLPHFEKMLYDQAMAISTYTQFYRVTGEDRYLHVAKEIIDFVNRDMKNGDGLYSSGLDSDLDGEEGKYYAWTPEELNSGLDREEREIIEQNYYLDDIMDGKIVLRRRESVDVTNEREKLLENVNTKLVALRNLKGKPNKDDKAILSWNSMLLSSMVKFSMSSSGEFSRDILKTADLIMTSFEEEGKIYRTIRNGIRGVDGALEDYSYYSNLMLDLYELTFEEKFLMEAIKTVQQIKEMFSDRENGGFFSTANIKDKAVVRGKDRMDIIYPSGESVLYLVLEKLYLLTGLDTYREMSDSILQSRSADIARNPLLSSFLLSYAMFRGKMKKLAISSDIEEDVRRTLGKHNFPDIVFSKGENGIELCNENFCQFYGKSTEDLVKYLISNI
jgi:uncharacterized protein YyaL (SSP411 family)